MSPILVQNLMKQQPQTFDSVSSNTENPSENKYQQRFHHQSQRANHNYDAKEEQKTEETITKYLYPPKKYKSVEPGTQTVFNVGYSIGFGSGSVNEKPQPSKLNSAIGNEEVVTGKPKQPFRIRVEGKNSYWKQLSPSVEMSQNLPNEESSASTQRNQDIQIDDVPTEGRQSFNHDQALISSNPFDISNAVEPLLANQPIALPLSFPLPLQDTILLQAQPTRQPFGPIPTPTLHNFPNDIKVSHPRTVEIRKQPKFLDAKATSSGNFQQTAFLSQDNFNPMNNVYTTPQPDNIILPSMQQVFITVGKDGQLIPAYLIPMTALNHIPTMQSPVFPDFVPQRPSNGHRHYHHDISSSATEPHIDPKPFKPSQPLNIEPQISHHQARQISNDLFKQGILNGPKNIMQLRPPLHNLQQPGYSYQLYEQDARPKIKTLLQVRPVQLPVTARPPRDLASEQSMLNAILSQELYRKNSPSSRIPVVPQTIYGVKNY